MNNRYKRFISKQYGGATLLFVLIVLIIITILGLASARSTLLQERMASTISGRNVVLQVAESALVELEEMIATTDPVEFRKNFQQSECTKGYCPLTSPVAEPPWKASSFWKDKKKTGQASKQFVPPFGEITPQYVIEDFGYPITEACDPDHIDGGIDSHCPLVPPDQNRLYRITVLAQTTQGMSAMVQSQFLDPNVVVK